MRLEIKVWLAGVVPALALHAMTSPAGVTLRAAIEAMLLGAGLVLLAPRVAPRFSEIPRGVRRALLVLLAFQLFAQTLGRNFLTYPGVQFAMYGYVPSRDVTVRVPAGVMPSGERVQIRPASAFPPLDCVRLSFRIADLAELSDENAEWTPCLDDTLRALGRASGAREVELVERKFRADQWSETEGTVLRRVEVAP